MDITQFHNLLDWYKEFSLEGGEELILNLVPEDEPPQELDHPSQNQIISSLVEFVTEGRGNSDNFPLYPKDILLISSANAINAEFIPQVLTVLWYGLGLQTGDYDLWDTDRIIQECGLALTGKTDNVSLLIRNIREVAKDENAIDFCQKFLHRFILADLCTIHQQANWHAALVIAIALDTVFEHLYQLSSDEQKDVIQHSCYIAISAGIDVEASLKSVLFYTKTVFSFITTYQRLVSVIETSTESVMGQNNQENLGSLLKTYFAKYPSDWSDESKAESFCYGLPVNEFYQDNILIIFKIVISLKTATLQKENYGDKPAESEEYRNEVIRLLFWFGIGQAGYEDLKKYFLQKENRVSISSFIKRLSEVLDLGDISQVENILIFSQSLRELNWMTEDQNLLSFHESDSQFHWNEEFLS